MPPGRFYPSDCEADDDAEEEASSLSQLFSDSEFERKLANGSRLEDPLFRNQSGTSSDDLPDSSSINNPTLAPQSLSSGTPDYHDSEGGEEGNSASEEVESRAVDSPEDKLPEAPKKAEPAGVAKMEARKLLRTMVDRELGRVQEQVEAALTALQKSPGFKKASEDEQIRMEEELDEESNVCINNLLWLLKQENGESANFIWLLISDPSRYRKCKPSASSLYVW